MSPSPTAPAADLGRVADAQARFDAAIAGLDDEAVRAPSALPDWSVAHVLSHVARNAESHLRRIEAARDGRIIDQYPGGYAGRAAEIDEGAARDASTLVREVRQTGEQLLAAWNAVTDDAWSATTRDVGGRERPLRALPARRWQELEVHAVDLGVGATHRDWPDEFVDTFLPRLRETLPSRLPGGAEAPPRGLLDTRDELAWLYGRLHRPDLPELAPWG